jgi:hypothetical protein
MFRRRWGWRRHSAHTERSAGYGYPDSDSDRDADGEGYRRDAVTVSERLRRAISERKPYAGAAHGRPAHADPGSLGIADAGWFVRPDRDADVYSEPVADIVSHAEADGDTVTHAKPDAEADFNADADTDAFVRVGLVQRLHDVRLR